MKQNYKDIPEFDDMVFARRNREYGAYLLRKQYNSVIIKATLIASFSVSILVIFPFVFRPSQANITSTSTRQVHVAFDNLKSPEEEKHLIVTPVPPQLKKNQESIKYVPPEVIDTVYPLANSPATDDLKGVNIQESLPDMNFGLTGEDQFSSDSESSLAGSLFVAEVMPSFEGGDTQKFAEWVGKNMIYPREAVDRNIKGTVIVSFVVETDGTVKEVAIVRGVDPVLDNEAVKVISKSPRWSPGLQRGRPVRIRFIIPLHFASDKLN
jgi:periplasmic protein TonB